MRKNKTSILLGIFFGILSFFAIGGIIVSGEDTISDNTETEKVSELVTEETETIDYCQIYNDKLAELDTLSKEDRQQWFIEYKEMITSFEGNCDDLPLTIYDTFNKEETDLLFAIVQCEIGDTYSFSQKVNVANVIFNRVNLENKSLGEGLYGVLTQKGQFSVYSSGIYKKAKVSEETILACEYAFLFPDTTGGALFFDSRGQLNYSFIFNDGAHNFYK